MARRKKNNNRDFLFETDIPVHRPFTPLFRRNAAAAEIYATNLLYVSSSVSMAQMFATQVQNMARHENLATLAVYYGPHSEQGTGNITNDVLEAKILKQVKKNAATGQKIESELRGAPVVT